MAWTLPRTWTDGELVTASIMNTHVRDNFNALGAQYSKMKAADETVNNSAVLQNDDDFVFPVLANEKWALEIVVRLSTGTIPDWKYNWTVPASTTYRHMLIYNNSATVLDWLATDGIIVASATAEQALLIKAFFVVAGTAGNVQFQWAQNTADASNTIVKTGSYMIAQRIN